MQPFIIGGLMIIVTVIADVFIKNASLQNSFSGWRLLLIGSILYGLTGLGWFSAMRGMKLSLLGVFYGVGCLMLLVLLGVFYYHEKLNLIEILGIVFGLLSLIILFRFG